jgi:C-terminal peptidase prc
MAKYWRSTAAFLLLATVATVALAQQPEQIPAPQPVSQSQGGAAAQPAPPAVPGFEQLRKFLFPQPANVTVDSNLKGAHALYKKTLTLWKENALVFMDLKAGNLDWSRSNSWYEKWEKRSAEIKDEKDFATADLLILMALDDLGERFNYYLTPDDVESENKQTDPTAVGIGARFQMENMEELLNALAKNATEEDAEKALIVSPKHRIVLTPIKGSPSESAGLKAGDILKKVDGEDVNGKTLRSALKLIKGRAGTQIELEVERTGPDSKPATVKLFIRRQPFTHPVVHETDLDNDIVLIKLDHFSAEQTQAEMEAALRRVAQLKLEKKKPVKLILDLRDNPGGRLDFAVNIVSYMLPEGNIVTLKERKGDDIQITRWTATRDALIYSYPAPVNPRNMLAISPQKRTLLLPEDVPLVILINHRSASASELTSRTLQFYKRAVVVGESTYGKGVGQQVYDLPDKRRGKVIKFIFYPGDQDIDWQGVHPNPGYEVKWQKPAHGVADNQLEAAKKAVLAEYERIEKEKEHARQKRDAAIQLNKEEFEKRKQQRAEELERQAKERADEQLKKKGGNNPAEPKPGAKPDSKQAEPGKLPAGAPGTMPPANDNDD